MEKPVGCLYIVTHITSVTDVHYWIVFVPILTFYLVSILLFWSTTIIFSFHKSQDLHFRKSKANKRCISGKNCLSFPGQTLWATTSTFSHHLVSFKHNSFSNPPLSACLTEVFLSAKITGPAFKSTPLLFLLSVPFPPIKALKVQSYACLLRRLLISVNVDWLGLHFYR